ncbi:MAG: hypothetical protein RLZZ15_2996, partial [Verrucomicrobiota bacterium]
MGTLLSDVWTRTVARAPAAAAVIDGVTGRTWSRGELARAAGEWGATGAATELGGRRVVLVEPNGPGWWIAFLGLCAAGAVPAPLDATEPPERRSALARAVGAGWIWEHGRLERVGPGRRARDRAAALIKITSGSTGAPRALVFTAAQMLADGAQVAATMKITGADRNLATIPLGHSYGLGNLVLPLVAQGTALVCAPSPLPHAIAAECRRWRPTVWPAVPAVLDALTRSAIEPEALASLRLVISAGAPLRAGVAAAFAARFGRRIHGFYGASETGGICFDRDGAATLEGRSVGAPLEGVAVEFGRGGRFAVRSAAALRGRFRPADRGRWNEHGELVLLGRAGRMIKIAARRVDLGEVERALREIPGVRDTWACAHPDRPDAIAAAVVAGAGAGEMPAAQIRAGLATRLAAWKVPARIVVLTEFPLTARGKLDTARL